MITVVLIVNVVLFLISLLLWVNVLYMNHRESEFSRDAHKNAVRLIPEVAAAPENFYATYGFRRILVAEKKEYLKGALEKIAELTKQKNELLKKMKDLAFGSPEVQNLLDEASGISTKITCINAAIKDYMNIEANLFAVIYSGGNVEKMQ